MSGKRQEVKDTEGDLFINSCPRAHTSCSFHDEAICTTLLIFGGCEDLPSSGNNWNFDARRSPKLPAILATASGDGFINAYSLTDTGSGTSGGAKQVKRWRRLSGRFARRVPCTRAKKTAPVDGIHQLLHRLTKLPGASRPRPAPGRPGAARTILRFHLLKDIIIGRGRRERARACTLGIDAHFPLILIQPTRVCFAMEYSALRYAYTPTTLSPSWQHPRQVCTQHLRPQRNERGLA